MPSSPADRNLLFGILALQMDFIGRDALVAAMNAWVLAKHRPLGDILVEQKALSPDVVADLNAIVKRHEQIHPRDSTQSVVALTVVDARSILAQVVDPDVQTSLRRLPGSPVDDTDSGRAATIPQPTREPADSDRPPRFTILRPHAKGGLGEVFVAHDDELNREVALKEMQVREDRNPDSRHRFVMEAEITGRLEHPGIVPVYGLGSYSDGRPYYAMRLIEGEDLREAIKGFYERDKTNGNVSERRVAFRELLGRFVDVCNAIAFAHSKGVLHRDLKPENVMLGKYGETLVVDWGLAKPIGRAESPTLSDLSMIRPQSGSGVTPTQMGSAVGTPSYMSPEQASGRLDQLGTPSDIYSLGATLYTLLTGKKSVDGDLVEVLRKVQRGDIVPPRQVNPACPEPLDAICRKAMSVNPNDRYASALDLAQDVELWLSDEPVSAWREPPLVRAGRWVRKHRTLVATALATLSVAVVGLLAVAAVQTKSGRDLAAKNRELKESNAQLAESRDRAERRFDLAVGAIENFRSAVDGNLDVKNRPENANLRKTLLQTPLAFYQKMRDDLSENQDARPEGRAKLADAYFSLATIDREIGSQADALKAYDETVSLLDPLWHAAPPERKSQLRAQLARALHDRGRLQMDSQNLTGKALESLHQARDLREAAVHDKPDDVAMRVRLADTLDALALLENRKGNADEALATLRKSIAMLEDGRRTAPDDLRAGLRLAHAHAQVSYVLGNSKSRIPDALASAQAALKIAEPLAQAHPADADCQMELCANYLRLAQIHDMKGELDQALAIYQKRLKIVEDAIRSQPTFSALKAEQISAIGSVALTQDELGQSVEALASLQRARELATALVRDNPTNIRFKDMLSSTLTKMASPLYGLGRLVEALAAIQEGAVVLEEMSRAEPDNVSTLRDLAGAHYNSGLLNATLGRSAAAEAAYKQSLTLRERLAQAHPDDTRFAHDVAATLGNISAGQEKAGKLPEALASLERAAETYQKLITAHPESAEFQSYLLRARVNVSLILTKMKQGAKAIEMIRPLLEPSEELVRKHPGVVQYQKDLVAAWERLAEALRQVGKPEEGATWAQKAADSNDKLLKTYPNDPDNRVHASELLSLQTKLALECKRPADVVKFYRKLLQMRDVKEPTADQLYNLACAHAQIAAAGAVSGSGMSAAEVKAEADQAMETLNRSVAAGFNDVENMRKDTDLESLHNRDDFKKLVERLQQSKKSAAASKTAK